MRIFTIIVLTFFSFTAKAQKKVVGNYYSKKSSEFHLQLFENLTFYYDYHGHMGIKDNGTGKYYLSDENLIYLNFDKIELDSMKRVAMTLKMSIRPKKLMYKSGKLFFIDKNNFLVKNNYLKRRNKLYEVAEKKKLITFSQIISTSEPQLPLCRKFNAV